MDLTPTAHSSFSLLINLCSSPILARKISTPSFLSFLVGYISHPTSILADLASMLLSNLTKFDDQSSRQLIEMRTSVAGEEVGGLELLLAAFDQGASVSAGKAGEALEEMKRKVGEAGMAGKDVREAEKEVGDGERKSTCHFLASVFANVSALPLGRTFFTTPLNASLQSTLPLVRLFPYTEHPDLIRRGGCISTLKNCLFVKSLHPTLLPDPTSLTIPSTAADEPEQDSASTPPALEASSIEECDILPSLLLPLCTSTLLETLSDEEQFSLPDELQLLPDTHRAERDGALRLMLIECLLLLCTTFHGRKVMRARGVYYVVREMHKGEEEERIGEAVLRLVNLLQREESGATERDEEGGGEEGSDQRAIDELVGAEEEGEDEDLVIEEL
ncbi:DUF383-domain-containing protein [Microstroma glucosiphilum]|uniref:DUF383-domain-containing protein n=1 Tax=Pseudomicrostroma glucosiphilum TaxID=1684307 RepID=A0A316UHI6_9BASI|nr:DUF383-domain-containing protein [Pseudomicrostroma glucosiphilum]PWN23393.1 DUF383-domain-containing protein [Pseudomicrostroma glucosiphilum]